MSGTIWLIVEGQNDADIVRAILKKRYPKTRVESLKPPEKNPNLAKLAKHIEDLIKRAKVRRKKGDCIAVLHDADLLSNPDNRADYERIRQMCEKYKRNVRLVVANDEIEAWLLADVGFCEWLKTPPRNCETMKQPSLHLQSLLDKASKPKYRIENLSKLLRYVNGKTHSPSLQAELDYLADKPCVK